MERLLWWLWFLLDPKSALLETTTQKEREAMGVMLDRQ